MSTTYPPAVWKGDGKSGGSFVTGPPKLVLHTTETSGVPGYNFGKSAPHLTYDPDDRTFYQHTEFVTAARALRNAAGGVQTNRDTAYQLEIVCYSDRSTADASPHRTWVGELSDDAYEDIAKFITWTIAELGVSGFVRLPRPKPKYGTDSPARMSDWEWDNFNGVAGHFEVPENTHWDTGALDIERLVNMANGAFPPNWEDVSVWAKDSWKKADEAGLLTASSEPQDLVDKEELMVFLDRAGII